MAAELIRPDNLGVGRILDTGRQFNDVAMMVATLIIILAIGLIVDALLFGRLETAVRRRYGLERR
jgi:NitT/TauT family transport system permease protein